MKATVVASLFLVALLSAGPSVADLSHEHQMVSTGEQATPVSDTVSYNTQTKKFHNSGCRYYNCGNCVRISRADAKSRGGVACKVCGG